MRYQEDGDFHYLVIPEFTDDHQDWLLAHVGNQAHSVPPKPYQVLSRWWVFHRVRYSESPYGRVSTGYDYWLGFRSREDAMRFKLQWA